MVKIASLFSGTACALLATAGFFAPQKTTSANAQTTPVSNYCMATSGDCAALSYGNTVYLYNGRSGGFWQEYAHEKTVTDLHFDGNGTLYLLNEEQSTGALALYTLDTNAYADGAQAVKTDVTCDFFLAENERVYYGNYSIPPITLYQASVDSIAEKSELCSVNFFISHLSYSDGTVYVLDAEKKVRALSKNGSAHTELVTLPADTKKAIVADNYVFYISETAFCRYDLTTNATEVKQAGEFLSMSVNGDTVYLMEESGVYAYSVTEDGSLSPAQGMFTYFQNNDALTSALNAVVREELPTDDFALVETVAGALLLEVEIKEDGTFAYGSSTRPEPFTALKIAQTGEYALLTSRTTAAGAYTTYLVHQSGVSAPLDVYESYEKTGSVTNAVHVYKFPDMAFTALGKLDCGERVKIVGEVRSLGCDYYAVEKEGKKGYIPKAYVTFYEEPATQTTESLLGDGVTDSDSVWQLVCLLLGVAAVGILIDYLILRPKRED